MHLFGICFLLYIIRLIRKISYANKDSITTMICVNPDFDNMMSSEQKFQIFTTGFTKVVTQDEP